MNDLTQILSKVQQGDLPADEMLPLVYNELRAIAQARLAQEKPGQTLQATALVHEAYLRLVSSSADKKWESRGHFFTAAAESIRRILIDEARRKKRLKRGGDLNRDAIAIESVPQRDADERLIDLSEALKRLESEDPAVAAVVKLRFFGGFSVEEAAEVLGISRTTANRHWTYARAWLLSELGETPELENS